MTEGVEGHPAQSLCGLVRQGRSGFGGGAESLLHSREIKTALDRIGVRRSEAQYKVGPYEVERTPFDSGQTRADCKVARTELPERARVYLSERGSDASLRQSVENAARREAAVTPGPSPTGSTSRPGTPPAPPSSSTTTTAP
ncbi:hypothetical protein ACIQWV_22030 [Streptomyces sp. NPDC098085]|uniref:hypothetical protein n=1 Tax=Streptomyces sp. NPDC098085 TaxID=3366094 RepID=UPI00381F7E10